MPNHFAVSTKLANDLNTLIEQRQYRISPRWCFEDRLARFIQMHFEEKGQCMELEDARCICNLILLKHSGNSNGSINSILSELQSSTKRRVQVGSNGKMKVTINYATHPMVTRSQNIASGY
jgi:hypothetical protein